MHQDRHETNELDLGHEAATDRVRMWTRRAATAEREGRTADAARCKDKARDWTSKVLHIERRQRSP